MPYVFFSHAHVFSQTRLLHGVYFLPYLHAKLACFVVIVFSCMMLSFSQTCLCMSLEIELNGMNEHLLGTSINYT